MTAVENGKLGNITAKISDSSSAKKISVAGKKVDCKVEPIWNGVSCRKLGRANLH